MAISVNNGSDTNPATANEELIDNTEATSSFDNPKTAAAEAPVKTSAPVGLSSEEQNDPNSITVTVSDPNTPIVILYGPPSCGKTMTLVRMTRYLRSKGYTSRWMVVL